MDLVLSLGFSVDNLKIVDTVFSDHKTVLFSANFPCDVLSNVSVPVASRVLTPHTASSFSAAFEVYPLLTLFESPCHSMDLEELVNQFNASCSDILDVVAPFKARKNKVKLQPWLNSSTRALRQECRRAERKWLKDKLQVSYEILKNCLNEYQRAVKLARANYFSAIISRNCHNSRVLFSTVSAVLHPVATPSLIPSADICLAFLHFFIGKVTGIRSQISFVSNDLIISVDPINQLTSFLPTSLQQLKDIIAHMKPTRSPGDVIPSSLFKKVFDTIGPSILSILNNSLSSGVVPASFKHAVIQPLLKKKRFRPL